MCQDIGVRCAVGISIRGALLHQVNDAITNQFRIVADWRQRILAGPDQCFPSGIQDHFAVRQPNRFDAHAAFKAANLGNLRFIDCHFKRRAAHRDQRRRRRHTIGIRAAAQPLNVEADFADHQIHEASEIAAPEILNDQFRILRHNHVRPVRHFQDQLRAGAGAHFITCLDRLTGGHLRERSAGHCPPLNRTSG